MKEPGAKRIWGVIRSLVFGLAIIGWLTYKIVGCVEYKRFVEQGERRVEQEMRLRGQLPTEAHRTLVRDLLGEGTLDYVVFQFEPEALNRYISRFPARYWQPGPLPEMFQPQVPNVLWEFFQEELFGPSNAHVIFRVPLQTDMKNTPVPLAFWDAQDDNGTRFERYRFLLFVADRRTSRLHCFSYRIPVQVTLSEMKPGSVL